MVYTKEYSVLASQIDANSHFSSVAYYDLFKSTLFSFFENSKFKEIVTPLDLWPVVLEESCHFYKEIFFDEVVQVSIYFSDISEKWNRYVCHGILVHHASNKEAAVWRSHQGILNRTTRKLASLPKEAVDILETLTGKN